MATSGTYSFSVSRDDLIKSSLRLIAAFDANDTIPSQDIADAAQALNIVAKELAIDGLPLWCIQEIVVPLVVGQATYNLSSTPVGNPLRILKAYTRDSSGNDTDFDVIARNDYLLLGQKSAPGTPNEAYFDAQLGASSITLYNVPDDASRTMHLLYQRQIQDFNLATDTPDFPQEAYRLLRWCLAAEIMLEYQTPADVRREISEKATALKAKFFSWEQEQVSVYFQPNTQQR